MKTPKNFKMVDFWKLQKFNKTRLKNHHRLKFYEKRPSYAGEKFLGSIPQKIRNEKKILLNLKNN